MTEVSGAEAQEREAQIRRDRARAAISTIAWTVGGSGVLFWSFAIGAAFGPAPLGPWELVAGMLFSVAVGLTLSSLMVRRRLDSDALAIAQVREARKRRRLVVFPEYLLVDEQVFLRSRLRHIELDDKVELVVTLETDEGSEVRTFQGPRLMLVRLRDELTAAPVLTAAG